MCRNTKNNCGTSIVLEVTNGQNCVSIPFMHLPLCPSYWQFDPPSHVADLQLFRSCFAGQLSVTFDNGFTAKDDKNTIIEISNNTKLTLYQYWCLKKITKSHFYAYIIIEHGNMSFNLPFRKLS